MILKEKVSDFKESGGAIDTDVETIDILGAGSAIEGGSVNTMSELMEEMEGLEE